MANTYLHGAYAQIAELANRASNVTAFAPVYIGTAPVFLVSDGASRVNVPVAVNNFAEAQEKFGYCEDWETYTLCEAMYAHFMYGGVGPIILINVLDPTTNVTTSTAVAKSVTAISGPFTVYELLKAALVTDVKWKDANNDTGDLTEGVDYTVSYTRDLSQTIITVTAAGIEKAAANNATSIDYNIAQRLVTGITASTVIGATDGEGVNTGVYALKSVYQATGMIPYKALAPGWSETKAVHDALRDVTADINGHWKAVFYSDIPVTSGGTQMTLSGAATWKSTNGYNAVNEKVFFPKFQTDDGRVYHLSVLFCVNSQRIDAENNNVPYMTASNTEIESAKKLWFGATDTRFVDAETLNDKLCKKGITTAAYVGGKWVLWGAHMANYNWTSGNPSYEMNQAVSDTTRGMMNYLCNSFQQRRAEQVDLPISRARLSAIQFEEQTLLDALVNMGALLYGKFTLETTLSDLSDIIQGDFKFKFEITTAPLTKSLTAYIRWTDIGIYSLIEE